MADQSSRYLFGFSSYDVFVKTLSIQLTEEFISCKLQDKWALSRRSLNICIIPFAVYVTLKAESAEFTLFKNMMIWSWFSILTASVTSLPTTN